MSSVGWRVVIDYGSYRNFQPVRSSEWTANYIADKYRRMAKHRGDTRVKVYVEKVVYDG